MTAKRILVIEDERIVARHLQNLIQRIGHVPVGHAASGSEAIRMAAETSPDLILMDLQLEGNIDGIAASAEIARNHSIPIVYITANSETFVRKPSDMVFPFLCIAKPFSAETVRVAIESAFVSPR
jgi:two-component system cell cycle sensor histidine kinase/response regulator CckA